MKLIAFAWSGKGPGHLARVAAISTEYRRLDDEADVLLFVPQGSELLADYLQPYVVVPSYQGMLIGD